jgi:hypothetical protein
MRTHAEHAGVFRSHLVGKNQPRGFPESILPGWNSGSLRTFLLAVRHGWHAGDGFPAKPIVITIHLQPVLRAESVFRGLTMPCVEPLRQRLTDFYGGSRVPVDIDYPFVCFYNTDTVPTPSLISESLS